jgi:hypothetical protein
MNMTSPVRFIHVACLLASGALAAQGSILYQQPLDNSTAGGYSTTSQMFADEFTVANGGTINQAIWYGGFLGGSPQTSFEAVFYADTGGNPGTMLESANGVATLTDMSETNSYGNELYQFTMGVPDFTATAAVPYFFSIVENTGSNMIWSDSNVGCCAFYNTGAGTTWRAATGNRGSQAFTLAQTTATPEPATFALAGLSVLVGLLVKRNRTRLLR